MSTTELWEEPLPREILAPPNHPLDDSHISTLWSMFGAIAVHWGLDIEIELLRSRWLDMLEARSAGLPDYRGEYINAANIFRALVEKIGEAAAVSKIYQQTSVTDADQAITRLAHAKFYVANDFIRCFVATGGFKGFVRQARNYTGFMGGSRFREWAPVRTGNRR